MNAVFGHTDGTLAKLEPTRRIFSGHDCKLFDESYQRDFQFD